MKIPKIIFIVGDSIVWGSDDKERGGWVDQFKIFFKNYAGRFNQVFNLGISGRNIRKYLDFAPAEIKTRLSSSDRNYLAIICLSINDAAFYKSTENFNVDLKAYNKCLQNLVNEINPLVDNIVFIGQTNIQENKTNPWLPWNDDYFLKNKNIEKYIQIAKDFCQKNNYLFINLYKLIDEEGMSEDGLHPNAQGHKKIYQKVKDELIKNKII